MRAIVQREYGPHRKVLHARDISAPTPGSGQVLVRVRATSVHADIWHAVNGLPYVLRLMGSGVRVPKQPVPGTDLAGEIVHATGRFAAGDRVFGEVTKANQWSNSGTFAEFAAVDEDLLEPIPQDLSFEQAAAVPTAALIALMNLRDQGRVRPGQRVLVNGAGGAVGVWAVQLAREFGAEVTAVDSPGKLEMLRDLGADHTIDYTSQDFTDLGKRYDIIFDTVGSSSFPQARKVLKPGGVYLTTMLSLPILLQMLFSSRSRGQRAKILFAGMREPKLRAKDLRYICDLAAKGELRPVIDSRYPLNEIRRAHGHVDGGHKVGSVILELH